MLPVPAPQPSLRQSNFQASLLPCCTCSSVWTWGTSTVMAFTESTSLCDCTLGYFPSRLPLPLAYKLSSPSISREREAEVSDHQRGEKTKLCWSTFMLRFIQPGVKCFCRLHLLYSYSTDTSITAVSIIFSNSGTRYHLEDTNNTWKTTELEERLKAPQVQTEKASRHFGGSFQTCSSIVVWGYAHAWSSALPPKALQELLWGYFLGKLTSVAGCESLLHKLGTSILMQGHSWPILMPSPPSGFTAFWFWPCCPLTELNWHLPAKAKKAMTMFVLQLMQILEPKLNLNNFESLVKCLNDIYCNKELFPLLTLTPSQSWFGTKIFVHFSWMSLHHKQAESELLTHWNFWAIAPSE